MTTRPPAQNPVFLSRILSSLGAWPVLAVFFFWGGKGGYTTPILAHYINLKPKAINQREALKPQIPNAPVNSVGRPSLNPRP